MAESIAPDSHASRVRNLRSSEVKDPGPRLIFGGVGAAIAVTGISRLAKSCGVTARALRYYEAEGLIWSSRSRQGERLFTPPQCEIAHLVVRLRSMDVAIVDIRAFLDEAVPETSRISTMRRKLERDAAELSSRLASLCQFLEDQDSLAPVRWSGPGEQPVRDRRYG